jgi:hypothetical protein
MIRTLLTIAAVSFVLFIGCVAGAFALAGGPFSIEGPDSSSPQWRMQHEGWPISLPGDADIPTREVSRVWV